MSDGADSLEWTLRLDPETPRRRYTVLAIALMAGAAGLVLFDSPLLSIIAVAAIVLSAAELFFPVKYRLDAQGARATCGLSVTAVAWSDVKRVLPMRDGLRLSPLEKPSRLEEFRGVYLRFSDNEEEVSGKIRSFWHGDASTLDRGTDRAGDGGPSDQAGDAGPGAEV
ncbi:MAG: hypothetical protein IH945_09130 [Armatimonadetes bacterium]|nr:hypothetical protein [Armatimonadota bacterium]